MDESKIVLNKELCNESAGTCWRCGREEKAGREREREFIPRFHFSLCFGWLKVVNDLYDSTYIKLKTGKTAVQ